MEPAGRRSGRRSRRSAARAGLAYLRMVASWSLHCLLSALLSSRTLRYLSCQSTSAISPRRERGRLGAWGVFRMPPSPCDAKAVRKFFSHTFRINKRLIMCQYKIILLHDYFTYFLTFILLTLTSGSHRIASFAPGHGPTVRRSKTPDEGVRGGQLPPFEYSIPTQVAIPVPYPGHAVG